MGLLSYILADSMCFKGTPSKTILFSMGIPNAYIAKSFLCLTYFFLLIDSADGKEARYPHLLQQQKQAILATSLSFR